MRKKKRKKRWIFLVIILLIILTGIEIFMQAQKPIVCIDAGHGGKDVREYFNR